MLVLGIDLETTWTEPVTPSEARIIEVGAVLWDTHKNAPVRIFNELVNQDNYQVPFELERLTGISTSTLAEHSIELPAALVFLQKMILKCEAIVAHNGSVFDKVVLLAEAERAGVTLPKRLWIDTRTDIDYPDHIGTKKLPYLACEHGFVNPFQHRAVFDVLTMLKIFSKYDLYETVSLAKEPTVRVVARVSFHDKQLAKDRGYHWDGENKEWFLRTKKSKSLKEENEAGFPVYVLEEK